MAPQSDLMVIATLLAGAGGAAIVDVFTRRVPNPLTALLAATGVLFAAFGVSGITVGASLAGLALGCLLMLPGHLVGATGAGDLKLLSAAGAVMGPRSILAAFIYTAIAGGVMALVVALRRRRFRLTLEHTTRLLRMDAGSVATVESPFENNRFAYAPAIAVGTLLAALGL